MSVNEQHQFSRGSVEPTSGGASAVIHSPILFSVDTAAVTQKQIEFSFSFLDLESGFTIDECSPLFKYRAVDELGNDFPLAHVFLDEKQNNVSSSYIRIEVRDIPGVLSSITKIFAKNKISIKNLIQNPDKKNNKASIIIITHGSLEKNYMNLLLNIVKNKFVLRKPTFIRVENV